jgi:hypothetical protein
MLTCLGKRQVPKRREMVVARRERPQARAANDV